MAVHVVGCHEQLRDVKRTQTAAKYPRQAPPPPDLPMRRPRVASVRIRRSASPCRPSFFSNLNGDLSPVPRKKRTNPVPVMSGVIQPKPTQTMLSCASVESVQIDMPSSLPFQEPAVTYISAPDLFFDGSVYAMTDNVWQCCSESCSQRTSIPGSPCVGYWVLMSSRRGRKKKRVSHAPTRVGDGTWVCRGSFLFPQQLQLQPTASCFIGAQKGAAASISHVLSGCLRCFNLF